MKLYLCEFCVKFDKLLDTFNVNDPESLVVLPFEAVRCLCGCLGCVLHQVGRYLMLDSLRKGLSDNKGVMYLIDVKIMLEIWR